MMSSKTSCGYGWLGSLLEGTLFGFGFQFLGGLVKKQNSTKRNSPDIALALPEAKHFNAALGQARRFVPSPDMAERYIF